MEEAEAAEARIEELQQRLEQLRSSQSEGQVGAAIHAPACDAL